MAVEEVCTWESSDVHTETTANVRMTYSLDIILSDRGTYASVIRVVLVVTVCLIRKLEIPWSTAPRKTSAYYSVRCVLQRRPVRGITFSRKNRN